MTLTQLLPTVDRLSHQDKLRLIHFLLLAVAREEGCNLEPDVPVILGHLNFFAEFNACFYRHELAFELHPRAK